MTASANWNEGGLKLTGGQLFEPGKGLISNPGLLVRNGRIEAVGEQAQAAESAATLDAAGQVIAPGFIDLCCNLREPGNGQKGNIASETRAAAHGGFTTVCASPETSPVNDSGAVTNLILDSVASRGVVRVLPIGAITRGLDGDMLSDMAGLKAAGCVAVGNGSRGVRNARILRRCMAYAQTFGLTVMFSPENTALAADGYAHDGQVTTRLGLLGIPEVAETAAVMEMLLLAEETGVRLHLSQLSCARSVEMLAQARDRGVKVTADVAMHQLVFTESALAGFDSRFHVRPPLRGEADRQALVAGVRDGVIDAIVSQHQPHDSAAKQAPLPATEPGLSSIESVLSLGLELVQNHELELPDLLRALTAGPAAVLGREVALTAGAAADLCLFDPDGHWQPSAATLLSAGRHAPVLERALPGEVKLTLVAGRTAWQAPGTPL
ncbi:MULTISPECIES: dihydroorotase [Marinobacter]|mgnify:FL=1|jgi:dihydroorotase|uniref:Dihydroorotase n=2 Tax=Marinobacter nauticus TaxID=2743 RepID=A1U760_MARN8|nr:MULTISPECIES: dihydroorotase [Marinobacter]MAH32442.1 dihydroorotase [Marinobacter sp.]MEC8897468.1 dihydroorotase [Pseudomonadota bacterium]ABM20829.1 dihydroorotase [Marinobacter nauticus VT8]ERS10984.1 dihydroorotase [Marinobacter sp. EN3]MAP32564.1 dihydroorotase [Marinobacter sp.]